MEEGATTGYRHWQFVCCFAKKVRLGGVKEAYGNTAHAELTRSDAAVDYCQKEETRVEGTTFELGHRPFSRSSAADWERVRTYAQKGRLSDIPADIYVRYYGNLKRIVCDHADPVERDVKVICYYGPSGVGKSTRARNECLSDKIYTKDPTTKWWDGYSDQTCVIIDEFGGDFQLSNLLRWTDRFGVTVEVKGGTVALLATQIFFTCNMHPREWYPNIKEEHWKALCRRIQMVECPLNMY